MGIEPTRPAWKAGILPLNYTRRSPFFKPLEHYSTKATVCQELFGIFLRTGNFYGRGTKVWGSGAVFHDENTKRWINCCLQEYGGMLGQPVGRTIPRPRVCVFHLLSAATEGGVKIAAQGCSPLGIPLFVFAPPPSPAMESRSGGSKALFTRRDPTNRRGRGLNASPPRLIGRPNPFRRGRIPVRLAKWFRSDKCLGQNKNYIKVLGGSGGLLSRSPPAYFRTPINNRAPLKTLLTENPR